MSGNSASVERIGRETGWTPVAVPGGTTPFDAAGTATGAYVVGTGGVVTERTDRGWRTVLDGVPGRPGADLRAVDATADDRVLWLVGDDGVVCEYDTVWGVVNRHAPPRGTAAPVVDVAATGDATAATVAVVTADGRAFRSTGHGFEAWHALVPRDADPVRAVAADDGVVAACTADRIVSATEEGSRRRLGDDFDATVGSLTVAEGEAWATDLDGSVHRWDGSKWRGSAVAEGPLRDVAVTDDGVVAVGDDGAAFVRDGRWERRPTPVAADLFAVASTRAGVGPSADGAPSTVALGPDRTLLER